MNADELCRAHLANIGNPIAPGIYTEDIVVTLPYAPKHHTGTIKGRDDYLRFLTNISIYFRDARVSGLRVVLTQNPTEVVIEFDGSSVSVETGLPYVQHYVSFLTLQGDQICAIREFYDPIQVLVSTGEIPDPSAGT